MVVRLCLREVNPVVKDQGLGVNSVGRASEWDVKLQVTESVSRIRLFDPFHDSKGLGTEPEAAIKWYLEMYIKEPFETTKADFAAEALSTYGRELAAQIAQSGLLPKHGDIELDIEAANRPRNPGTANQSPIGIPACHQDGSVNQS